MSSRYSEAGKKDFIQQVAEQTLKSIDEITAAGMDPTGKVTVINDKLALAVAAETEQIEAKRIAKEKTTAANETLDAAYEKASEFVELLAGLLGKKHPLVLSLRALRK